MRDTEVGQQLSNLTGRALAQSVLGCRPEGTVATPTDAAYAEKLRGNECTGETYAATRSFGASAPRHPDTLQDAFTKRINYHLGEAERLGALQSRLKANPLAVSVDEIARLL